METNYFNEEILSPFLTMIAKLARNKGAVYGVGGDRLRNFRDSRELLNVSTSTRSAWSFMVKHIDALRDMVMRVDEAQSTILSEREVLEKTGDIALYSILILACMIDERFTSNPFEEEEACNA